LRHRIFFALGFSIVLSVTVGGLVVHSVSGNAAESTGLRAFAGERFAAVWEEPLVRADLAKSIERHFDVRLALIGDQGQLLYGSASRCSSRVHEIDVLRGGRRVGAVRACVITRHWSKSVFLVLGSVVLVLWTMSGFIARALVRSLDELVRVARDIGNGRLSARVQLCGRIHRGEVGAVALAINQMAEKIERQIVGQRELLAAVSHEIRSPLARLRMLVELERETRETTPDTGSDVRPPAAAGKTMTRLDGMDVELAEMDRLIGQLLAQSRLEFQKLDLRVMPALELASAALSRSGLSLDKLLDHAADARVEVDATLFTRGLLNLIDNAQRHAGGLTELRLERHGDRIRFLIGDAGPGFDPSVEKQAFLPFVGSGKATGLGLGLALVAQIARAHGTDVHLSSTQQGATVGIDARSVP
jgi:signal transduction histidine kinase